jgi:hypothetical protein
MKQLKEIMITLFENSDGYTISVKPNHSYGGKPINFSFKGNQTTTLKAVKDMGKIRPAVAEMLREMINRDHFQSLYRNRDTVDEVRFSKGYLAKTVGSNVGKGGTVPVLGVLMRDAGEFAVYLDFGLYQYEAQLDLDAVTAQQRKSGAIAEHRWRDYSEEDDDSDIYDFLGDTDDGA